MLHGSKSSNPDTPAHPLLRVVLERVMRTECLVLEDLLLAATAAPAAISDTPSASPDDLR